jgi:hypothetical protein
MPRLYRAKGRPPGPTLYALIGMVEPPNRTGAPATADLAGVAPVITGLVITGLVITGLVITGLVITGLVITGLVITGLATLGPATLSPDSAGPATSGLDAAGRLHPEGSGTHPDERRDRRCERDRVVAVEDALHQAEHRTGDHQPATPQREPRQPDVGTWRRVRGGLVCREAGRGGGRRMDGEVRRGPWRRARVGLVCCEVGWGGGCRMDGGARCGPWRRTRVGLVWREAGRGGGVR